MREGNESQGSALLPACYDPKEVLSSWEKSKARSLCPAGRQGGEDKHSVLQHIQGTDSVTPIPAAPALAIHSPSTLVPHENPMVSGPESPTPEEPQSCTEQHKPPCACWVPQPSHGTGDAATSPRSHSAACSARFQCSVPPAPSHGL